MFSWHAWASCFLTAGVPLSVLGGESFSRQLY